MSIPLGSLDTILEQYPPKPEYLISVLQDIQEKFHYVPKEALEATCDHVGVSRAQGWAVVTFYKLFRLSPPGKHHLCLCTGTTCYANHGLDVSDALKEEIRLNGGDTSEDGLFTLEEFHCMGLCHMGPVMKVDDEYLGHLDPERALEAVKTLKEKEGARHGDKED